MRTRSAPYPDRATAQWCTQQVVTRNEQAVHRWLARGTRPRLTIEAAWPSREQPVWPVLLQAMICGGRRGGFRDAAESGAAGARRRRDRRPTR
ncbi:hypothetical protein [Streptomyces pratisoli]|uniref:hypothetical protein n=1 Tax=Streptomyces pratisoli TaxID=3139917 RepID=UPI003C12B8A9